MQCLKHPGVRCRGPMVPRRLQLVGSVDGSQTFLCLATAGKGHVEKHPLLTERAAGVCSVERNHRFPTDWECEGVGHVR